MKKIVKNIHNTNVTVYLDGANAPSSFTRSFDAPFTPDECIVRAVHFISTARPSYVFNVLSNISPSDKENYIGSFICSAQSTSFPLTVIKMKEIDNLTFKLMIPDVANALVVNNAELPSLKRWDPLNVAGDRITGGTLSLTLDFIEYEDVPRK